MNEVEDFNICPCGGTHELACGEFLLGTYRLAQDTCDSAHRRALEFHMSECGPCRGEYSLERNIKALVGGRCAETAPQALRDSVQQRIRQMVTVEHTETVVSDGTAYFRSSSTTMRVQRRPDPNA